MTLPTKIQVRLNPDVADKLGAEQLIEIDNPLTPEQTMRITNAYIMKNELLDLFAIIERDLLLPTGTLDNHKAQQVEGMINVYP